MSLEFVEWKRVWGPSVDICANTGIQFLDFQFEGAKLARFRSEFVERVVDRNVNQEQELKTGHYELQKYDASAALDDAGDFEDDEFEDCIYDISRDHLFKVYLDEWLPVPIFSKDQINQNGGPFNWARIRLTKDKKQESDTYFVQLAIDTAIAQQDDQGPYLQPSRRDADVEREFSFSSDFNVVNSFIRNGVVDSDDFSVASRNRAWVSDWLHHVFEKYLSRNARNSRLYENSQFEAWSTYIAFLELLEEAVDLPNLKLRHSKYSEPSCEAIDVDLILDIGNSRTCGLLLELPTGRNLELENVTQLTLRDLSNPENEYNGLFESRVEFANQNFGEDDYSRRSGKTNAFLWPSWVRFGPEAASLVARDTGNENFSGLSSPKRYLWDNSAFSSKWRFHNWSDELRLPRSLMASLSDLTEAGDSIEQIRVEKNKRLRHQSDTAKPARDARFSKSSLYGFMIMELIAHAFRQINDPKYRGGKELASTPRFLKNIIITLPTATPGEEHAIVKSKIRGAISLLWKRMEKMGQVSGKSKPDIIVDWDEATCTQVMYIYGEIIQKFKGNIKEFLSVFGRKRTLQDTKDAKDSIKLACVDIGGGTTDLMVTTFYHKHQRSLDPIQEFREGFRKAGDDLLCLIIENIILPKMRAAMISEQNRDKINTVFMNLFGKSVAGISTTKKHQRRQFSNKFLAPLALEIFSSEFGLSASRKIKIRDCSFAENINEIKHYIEDEVADFTDSWSLTDFEISVDTEELERVIDINFKYIFENISEVIHRLDVDFVILTGRPTKNQKIVSLFKSCCAVTPNRVIAISDYKSGSWYPFKTADNKVGDPKSTVSVGAMLIASTGSGRVSGLRIISDNFTMLATDKYIGRIENNGQIKADGVIFSPDQENDQSDLYIETDTFLGSRQLGVERWTANPLYKVYFTEPETDSSALPYELTISREDRMSDPDNLACPLIPRSVSNASNQRKENLKISLQTLGVDEEYWLDSGAFNIGAGR